MMNLPLLVEGMVVILLLVTICYCAALERRIRTFKDGSDALVHLVADLDRATARAEAAVGGLSKTTKSAEEALESRLQEARHLTRALALGNRGQVLRKGTTK
ncbi:hypothetical protein MNBD_ALPHA09-695 [hydrothermal vent metagenome]|uniref:DUF6468 domain-containing protein n=1 Tax=hydrothermal vent metagenome TaxID=652676 RepID=A0A3B0SZ94_9ZZZZ